MSKVFIVGLPRTGTTSLCKACIDLGFSTAHTAYTVETIVNAEVVADTPVFNDYMLLHRKYPDARFIYLERPLAVWLPSISRLLSRMADNLFSEHGGFNDTIKRCFFNTFQGLTTDKIDDFEFLETCYQQHRRQALHYFQQNKTNYICLDIADADCHDLLCQFLNVPLQHRRMPRLNVTGKSRHGTT
ncbi:sulfotransferase [Veronia pacifica]|uniref:Sulfotransferase family protein n=1 Tax=Veronia pacifica TaxID=1080227 RepID=A0A1C3EBJ2_9GAMM|nr:sulfotransferase [Veronia pacifica]ODA30613.1 hypothetical protein A8L45_19985 [Veronia pacifica]